jgi:DNA-binding transcriptional LysR family regulator
MRNLNPDQLQAFVSVIEEGGFTNAARLQVRELETRCGVQLIDRDGRRPKPTVAGEDLLLHAKRILAEQAALLSQMRRHRDKATGRVRVGMGTTTLLHIAGPALRRARHEQPSMQLVVEIGTTRELSHAVDSGDLDLGIVTLPVAQPNLKMTHLLDDELVAIFPAQQKDLPAEIMPTWLAGQPFIAEERPSVLADMSRQWFSASSVEPDVVMRLEHLAAMLGAVEAGLGASIVPRVLVKEPPPSIQVRRLTPNMTRTVALIERPNAHNPAVAALKQALLDGCRQTRLV